MYVDRPISTSRGRNALAMNIVILSNRRLHRATCMSEFDHGSETIASQGWDEYKSNAQLYIREYVLDPL